MLRMILVMCINKNNKQLLDQIIAKSLNSNFFFICFHITLLCFCITIWFHSLQINQISYRSHWKNRIDTQSEQNASCSIKMYLNTANKLTIWIYSSKWNFNENVFDQRHKTTILFYIWLNWNSKKPNQTFGKRNNVL